VEIGSVCPARRCSDVTVACMLCAAGQPRWLKLSYKHKCRSHSNKVSPNTSSGLKIGCGATMVWTLGASNYHDKGGGLYSSLYVNLVQ
jgi:hypothetical protein